MPDTVTITDNRTGKSIELKSLNTEHRDRTLPMSDILWVARIVWASQ